jgi:hypothetical protein
MIDKVAIKYHNWKFRIVGYIISLGTNRHHLFFYFSGEPTTELLYLGDSAGS